MIFSRLVGFLKYFHLPRRRTKILPLVHLKGEMRKTVKLDTNFTLIWGLQQTKRSNIQSIINQTKD